jgi:hypothetical protein
MTQDDRNFAIKDMIRRHTAANTVSKETARSCLIREGIYTNRGELAEEFGGPAPGNDESHAV